MTAQSLLYPSSATQIAALARAAQGQYGVVTHVAREHGIRRQRVYDLREQARAVLEAVFSPEAPASAGSFPRTVTPADMARAVVAFRVVTPASIRDIVEVLPAIYGVGWSYGKVWSVLDHAEKNAASLLQRVDLSGVEHISLDEMFSQRCPVLAGIDLDTQYLFQVEVHRDRTGDTWAQSLGRLRDLQGLHPTCVVKDAGSGLGAGVQKCWPGIQENDDLFHAVLMMGREAYHMERSAYRAIRTVDDLVHRSSRARTETKRRRFGQQVRWARTRMNAAIDSYDRFEALRREAGRLLELTDRGSGRLRTSHEVTEGLIRIAAEMKAIGGKRVRKVATYIHNRAEGLARYLDSLAERLGRITSESGGEEVVEAAPRAYQASLEVHRGGPAWDRKARQQELTDAARHLLQATKHDP